MKIGLFGYGKMGKAIERIAVQQGLDIAWRITRENRKSFSSGILREADVIIEFTRPEAAYENVMECLHAGIPVVCGTTGWLEQLADAEAWCMKNKGALLWASNFSVGVNLFFAFNRYAARLMQRRPEYLPELTEVHHIHKLDAPSGTALTLVQDILAQTAHKSGWALHPTPPGPNEIPVHAIREGEVPGTHRICWKGPVDEIVLEHRAHSRDGFGAGAVLAAQWLHGRNGVFRMTDVLGLTE